MYCTVKLRLPEDELINKATEQMMNNVKELTAKDTALTLWSLARMNYKGKELRLILRSKVLSILNTCLKEEYLFDA